MDENAYIYDILSGLGLAINEKNNNEIILNYPINYDKKNMEFSINSSYKISMQPIGTFLSDFLNTDFENCDKFEYFFKKYSLTLLDYNKILRLFKNGKCSEDEYKDFILKLLDKNKNEYLKLQKQTDIILDYCLLNPNQRAINFKPIQRLYVLRRISPSLTLLNENKSAYYSVNLFSTYPGDTEKKIYEFLNNKKNEVVEYDLILPYNISAIIYKSIGSILKGNVYLKVCKNCGKYFIAESKSYNYCTNIAPNEIKKTCRDIGRRNVFNDKKNKDALIALYYSVYNRKAMMKSRNPDIIKYVNDFTKYKEQGKKKLSKYKLGLLTPEEFKNWIEKNV